MEREGDLARRRQARLQELQDYVRQRLEEIKVGCVLAIKVGCVLARWAVC